VVEGLVSEPSFVARYRKNFEATWDDNTPIHNVRYVVLDCETTGLNPDADRIITIGAVAVVNGEILIKDSFDALLKMAENSAAVTVHGVTRDESRSGLEEPVAFEMFLDYLRDGVIVGHHIGHDVAMLDAGCERHWGFRLFNRCLDTMYLALHLQNAGAFPGRPRARRFTLDALCDLFGVVPHGRHTADGDAFLTAQVFLRLCALARKHGRNTLGALCAPYQEPQNS
jgi:DNA polymerase-3 subunit epsilon